MLKIEVITSDGYFKELRNLRPRSYMCGYTFEQLMEYTKEERYWQLDENEEIVGFIIKNPREHWCQPIMKK